MKTSVCAVAMILAAACIAQAWARDYASDPVANFLQTKEDAEWGEVKKAHQADWATQGIDELATLAETEGLAPRAVLTILMMACHGSEAAEQYILDTAESADSPAGVLAVMGSIFLDHGKAIPRLISRMGRSDRHGDFFKGAAGTALGNLTGVCMESDQARWQEWWQKNKENFKPDNRVSLPLYRYEMENGPLTTRWVFDDPSRDDCFMGLLEELNGQVRKFDGERWPLEKTLQAMRDGRFDEARQTAEAALNDCPSDAYALYIAGCMALQTDETEAAQKHFDTLVALNSRIGSAKLLASYCKEMLAAGKKEADIDILLKLFRGLPPEATHNEWDVPTTYIFERVFVPSQETVERFARENVTRPELLAGAVMLMKDCAKALDLLNAGIKNSPSDALLRLLRLQSLIQSGISENAGEMLSEIKALSLLDADNGLLDCLSIAAAGPDALYRIDPQGRGTPLTEDEVRMLTDAAGRKRFTAMGAQKTGALLESLRKMGAKMPVTLSLQARKESPLPKPQWLLDDIAARAGENIAAAVAGGDIKKAEEIYALLETLANKIAGEDNSLNNASLALCVMSRAENAMAEGYRQRGDEDKAAERWEKFEQRAKKMGIEQVDLDDFGHIRRIPVPRLAEAFSAAAMADERGLYGKYPPVFEGESE